MIILNQQRRIKNEAVWLSTKFFNFNYSTEWLDTYHTETEVKPEDIPNFIAFVIDGGGEPEFFYDSDEYPEHEEIIDMIKDNHHEYIYIYDVYNESCMKYTIDVKEEITKEY